MAMTPDEVKACILRTVPDAEITLESLVDDGDHYKATVVSKAFAGLSRVKQHQMVMDGFEGRVGNELHALSIVTKTPN